MAAYIVVQIRVRDAERYERYKNDAQATLAAYGGRYVVRGAPCEILEGAWQPPRFVVLEFPDKERARAWWSSADYAPAKDLRQATADTDMILVQGVDA